MNNTQLIAALKKMNYADVFKGKTSRIVILYLDKDIDRATELKVIAPKIKGKYTNKKSGTGWKSSVGAVEIPDNLILLAKPKAKGSSGSNYASLDARVFSQKATTGHFMHNNQNVEVATFTNASKIEESIIYGAKTNSLLGEPYSELYEEFFSDNTINWTPSMPRDAINKLGVYVGELLVGWVFLKNKKPAYFSNDPFTGTAKAFHIPTDPAFSGVDSFIEMQNGTYYAISSKYGAGAKASFFTNLFEKGVNSRSSLKQSYFKRMCDYAASNNINFKKSKDFVYGFGIREVLGIGADRISNPSQIYTKIIQNRIDDEVKLVTTLIDSMTDNVTIKNNLPNSVSAFFNRSIADKLNNDPASISQMTEILAGKDYWQANLDTVSWRNGKLKFRFINSGGAKINIIGSKAAITDISCKQGWINYELKYE